jgi:mannose-6-phosphate isomerase-like protein (cupin superfamily)
MPKVSRDTASRIEDFGKAEDRTDELEGYTVNFVTIKETHDLAEMLKGLPGGNCSCPHWGYLFKGRLTVRYPDREEVFGPGDAFYMPPGHVPEAEGGSEFVQFSPTHDMETTMAAIQASMQAQQG